MSVLASSMESETEKRHVGKGGRELQGQAVPQSPPTSCLLLCPQTLAKGGKGDKGKPDAGDNGVAMIQRQWRSIFSLSPKMAWREGAGLRGWGLGDVTRT